MDQSEQLIAARQKIAHTTNQIIEWIDRVAGDRATTPTTMLPTELWREWSALDKQRADALNNYYMLVMTATSTQDHTSAESPASDTPDHRQPDSTSE